MNLEILRESGLTESEARVYRALLELGPSLAGQISRKTGLHRRNVYDVTERLIKKGLIGYILKNHRRIFQASSPERFLEMVKEKENLLQEVMPEMMMHFQSTKEKEETNFYKGKQGLKAVFEDQLNEKEVLILGASKSAFDILPFYFKWYDQARVKKKIHARIISSGDLGKKISLSEIRYLPEKYSSPLAINIYGNKVALILWSKENPIAIVINDRAISEGYKKYFELLWKIAKQD